MSNRRSVGDTRQAVSNHCASIHSSFVSGTSSLLVTLALTDILSHRRPQGVLQCTRDGHDGRLIGWLRKSLWIATHKRALFHHQVGLQALRMILSITLDTQKRTKKLQPSRGLLHISSRNLAQRRYGSQERHLEEDAPTRPMTEQEQTPHSVFRLFAND